MLQAEVAWGIEAVGPGGRHRRGILGLDLLHGGGLVVRLWVCAHSLLPWLSSGHPIDREGTDQPSVERDSSAAAARSSSPRLSGTTSRATGIVSTSLAVDANAAGPRRSALITCASSSRCAFAGSGLTVLTRSPPRSMRMATAPTGDGPRALVAGSK